MSEKPTVNTSHLTMKDLILPWKDQKQDKDLFLRVQFNIMEEVLTRTWKN
jgi:hypothetical protein